MSHQARTWAYKQAVGNPIKKFLLLEIADHANEDGYSYAGQESYAYILECEVRTIRRHMQALEEEGYIRRERRYRDDNTRTSDGCWLLAPAEQLKPPKRDRSTGQNVRKGEGYRTMTTDLPDTKSGPIHRTEPSGEPSGEGARETSPVVRRCVQLLSSIKGHKKTEAELTDLVEELSKKYPSADAEQACSDLEFNIRHGSDKMERLAGKLKTYFRKDAEKRPAPSANGKRLHAEGEVWTEDGKTFKKVGGEKIEVLN